MKYLASLGLISSLLLVACGDNGGASTGSGTTDSTTATGTTDGSTGSTATGTTTDPTTGATGSETMGQSTGTTTSTTDDSSTGSSSTAPVTDTGTTSTTSTTGTSTGQTTDTTDTTDGTSSSGTSDSSTGDPGDPLTISLKDVVIYSNCQPIIDPDSILGWWTVVYDNSKGVDVASAELTGAVLTLSPNNNPSVHDITVTPTMSGPVPAMSVVNQDQMKQKGAAIGGCGFCNQPFKLELVFTTGGVDVPVVHEANLDCVY